MRQHDKVFLAEIVIETQDFPVERLAGLGIQSGIIWIHRSPLTKRRKEIVAQITGKISALTWTDEPNQAAGDPLDRQIETSIHHDARLNPAGLACRFERLLDRP